MTSGSRRRRSSLAGAGPGAFLGVDALAGANGEGKSSSIHVLTPGGPSAGELRYRESCTGATMVADRFTPGSQEGGGRQLGEVLLKSGSISQTPTPP